MGGIVRGRFLALALLAARCSHSKKPATAPEPQAVTTLRVENGNLVDMKAYVVSGSQRSLLGLVSGGHTEVFTIPAIFVRPGSQLQFEFRPVSGGVTPRSQRVAVNPGDQVRLAITPY
jgi:hypothetical protein